MIQGISSRTETLYPRHTDFRNPIGREIIETHKGYPKPLLRNSHNRTRGRGLRRVSGAQSPSSGSLRVRGEINNLRFLTHLQRGLSSPPRVGTVVLVGQGGNLFLGLRACSACFMCGAMGHMERECPQGQIAGNQRMAALEPIVGDMGRSHRVFAVVNNRQVEHQATVIEAAGMIRGNGVSILFDSGASDSFISPLVVEHYELVATRQGVSWEVELALGARVSVESEVRACQLQIGNATTLVDLRVTPLGSYGIILGMDWLYARAKMDCHLKVIECGDDQGSPIVIKGIQRPVSLRMIFVA